MCPAAGMGELSRGPMGPAYGLCPTPLARGQGILMDSSSKTTRECRAAGVQGSGSPGENPGVEGKVGMRCWRARGSPRPSRAWPL